MEPGQHKDRSQSETSRTTNKDAKTGLKKDFDVLNIWMPFSPESGRSEAAMPPCTPPRGPPSGRIHESPDGSTTTTEPSPGFCSITTSPASTAPSSATSSPRTSASVFKSDRRELNSEKQPPTQASAKKRVSFKFEPGLTASEPVYTPEESSQPSQKLGISSDVVEPLPTSHAHNHTSSANATRSQPVTSDIAYIESISLSSLVPVHALPVFTHIPTRPACFSEPPSLDLYNPTTFGPYTSPHTLAELHDLAWANQHFLIEPCLQCELKGLECPFTVRSPTNAHMGPLMTTIQGKTIIAERDTTAHPRFPACLRCIRNGEADKCIVQRRATMKEIWAFRVQKTVYSEVAEAEVAKIIFPTDRDVADPELFAAKLRLREDLLLAHENTEEKKMYAPTTLGKTWLSTVRFLRWDEDRILRAKDRDRALLSDSKGVLLPHELWGSRWAGRKEKKEREWFAKVMEISERDRHGLCLDCSAGDAVGNEAGS